jgi:hypothetical protein
MEYKCEYCDYRSKLKYRYERHLKTKKHLKLYNGYKIEDNKYQCLKCNKNFENIKSIHQHMNHCNVLVQQSYQELNVDIMKELMCSIQLKDIQMEKQNTELMKLVKDLSIQKSNIHIEANTNSNNKMLNYNNITNYLNDKCKDALNVEDFIPMIQVTLNDLLKVSNNNMNRKDAIKMILEDNLNKIDFDKQPFKCSDIKRKKIYAKTAGEWINDEEYKQTKKVFRHINNKAAMKSEEPKTKEILEQTDMSSYELRKPLSYGCTDIEIERCIETEKRILSEISYFKNDADFSV